MRKAILAFVMVAIVVAAAQPAGAVDDRFRGWYRLVAREAPGATCRSNSYGHRIHVRYVNEKVRDLRQPRADTAHRFRYVPVERFPWQGELRHRAAALQYDSATDTAVGFRSGLEGCRYRLRLIPIG
jgi:hypothetical protein